MDAGTYEAEAVIEATHWWFAGRRKLFARILSPLPIERTDPVLDVGPSTGTNLRMLRELGFTKVRGLDASGDAIRFCAEKGLGTVQLGDVTRMPFEDESFSLVLATDVIEHVQDDQTAIREIARVLKPGAHALFTVPAFSSLWGFQDEVAHHFRRYREEPLRQLIRNGGLEVVDSFYFNYLLFAPIWGARQVMKLKKPNAKSEGELNAPWLNRILGTVFDFDTLTAQRVRPPFGVSILVLATNSQSTGDRPKR